MADLSEEEIALLQVAKLHWRSFWPAWVFPAFMLFGGLLADKLNHPLLFFNVLGIPLFFWSGLRAVGPWVRREIRYTHFVFWSMIVPFITWGILVFARIFLLLIFDIKP